ncbi:tyrosine-type recombinase/integrase [Alkalibacillus almallahensis]|uniref:tyrosine-type recombinase/integrase n=1 Tax=Alkalibacillus almallahensis TaxID=1379154 RepID=UPI0014217682|nr:tyrosine-type recombinase/integrase [Alkalibacillus almallahensis]NIK13144.1 integrase [Alkalibacillus almallahensis]
MENVQPIKDRKLIEDIKTFYLGKERDYFLFAFGINIALRISDLLQLKVKDVRGKDSLKLYETKNKNNRYQKLSPQLKNLISEYTKDMDDNDWLFLSQKGDKPISRVQAHRILEKAEKAFKLESFGTHSLRKTFGYLHYQRHKDVAILQRMFGHSSPSITLRYIGVEQDEQDKSTENFFI